LKKFADKIERLKAQQKRYKKVLSKRHPSDEYCPNCDSFITRLNKEKQNSRKTINTICPNPQCNGKLEIIYHTNELKAARVFAIGYTK
jgi:hypothetical protein